MANFGAVDIAVAGAVAGRFLPWVGGRAVPALVAIDDDRCDMPFAVSPCMADSVRTITILGGSADDVMGPDQLRRVFDAINEAALDG